MSDTDFSRRVRQAVRSIPEGRVSSYGTIAALAGSPGAARAVGAILSALEPDDEIPWWRVVGSGGRITTSRFHHTAQIQRTLLEEEGVDVDDRGRIPWRRFGWDGPDG